MKEIIFTGSSLPQAKGKERAFQQRRTVPQGTSLAREPDTSFRHLLSPETRAELARRERR